MFKVNVVDVFLVSLLLTLNIGHSISRLLGFLPFFILPQLKGSAN